MVVGNILIINIAITVTAFIAMINIGIANAVATICWLTCAGLKFRLPPYMNQCKDCLQLLDTHG